MRAALEHTPLPAAVSHAALYAWRKLGSEHAYAVRSSATAEDLPGASFAGQQETYLNIRGEAALLDAIRLCFASLFTDRAILYRAKNGFGHRGVSLSVVVQRMVFPDAAGILFTADPVTGHRGTVAIDAGFGLGEALVSGLVIADLYRLDKKTGAIKEVRVGDKAVAIRPLPGGGTVTEELPAEQRTARVLDDAALAELYALAKKVEALRGGAPQDIEWCLCGKELFLVQARPITSLYPLPTPRPADSSLHVYVSFNHAQNMIDPISPFGRDVWRALFPLGKASFEEILGPRSPLTEAGGRLYLDVSTALRIKPLRKFIIGLLRVVYPEVAARLELLADRPEVQAGPRPRGAGLRLVFKLLRPIPPRIIKQILWGSGEELLAWGNHFIDDRVRKFHVRLASVPPGAPRLREAHVALSQLLIDRFGSEVPRDRAVLETLPGVGRKTANLVVGQAFAKPAICVDTHVHRISNRLGWVRTDTPEETEHALYATIDARWWPYVNLYLVTWGQNCCRPV